MNLCDKTDARPAFDIPGIYNEREALLRYLKVPHEREHELVTLSNDDGLHTFKMGNLLFEVYCFMNKSKIRKFSRGKGSSVAYSFNSSLWSIDGVLEHRCRIDVEGLYTFTRQIDILPHLASLFSVGDSRYMGAH